jgi:HAMP domain-containing protein
MKSIRRLYFYLVAFISIEIVLWGLVSLLRSIVDETVSGGADALAQALALIMVGVPIFLIHWLWVQRASAQDEEEKTATLRAVFFYAILLATLIPVVQNLLSFIDRSFVQIAGLGVSRAFRAFSEQTLADNLIAIVMNGIVAAYFWNILRNEWGTLPDKENFADVRRLYRYIWMLYGLLMTVFGAQQILRFIFSIPGDVLGELGREMAVNGIALLFVGTPVWIYSWRLIQDSLADPAEMGSTLRLIILYLLALGGVITVITATWVIVNTILLRLLGQDMTLGDFTQRIGGPVSIGVPLGAVWAYYGYWLNRHIEAVGDRVRQASMKRLYNYILAFIGLVVSFVGVASLFSLIIDMLTGSDILMSDATRGSLAISISSLIVGLPLWLVMWRPMQAEATAQGELGDHARRSVIRKTYLYLVLFASVIGGMATAVGLVYQLIRVVLTGDGGSNFVNDILNLIQLLFLFGVVLVYHLSVLRADGASTADSLAEKQSRFKVLVIDSGDGFAQSVKAALMKFAPKAPVTVTAVSEKPEGDFNAVVLNGSLAVDAPEWIRSFGGSRIIVQDDAKDIVWTDDAVQAAQSVQQLAEGQEIRMQKTGRSPWMVVVYIFAALFGLILLLILVSLGISLVVG